MLWTSTIASEPGTGVRQQWNDLMAVLQAVGRNGWFARHEVMGTARAVEVEQSNGAWHVHGHTVLILRDGVDASALSTDLVNRYLEKADRLGVVVSRNGQDVRAFIRADAIRYITKAGVRLDGHDTPSRLWADVQRGDADALALVHEIEVGTFRRRQFVATGWCRPIRDFDDWIERTA